MPDCCYEISLARTKRWPKRASCLLLAISGTAFVPCRFIRTRVSYCSIPKQPARLFCSRQTIEIPLPCPAIFIIMQCKLLVAFVVACFAMTVSAAPVGANEAAIAREPEALNLRLPRIEVAREPEPVVEEAREPKPEPGCTLYTCI
ncbi:hypothetical protein R3P38DRAFT_1641792 [Favolaschia claudopus]|uniref:Uncharacterized protein n=1 Tax=Favolaschia claudopus TaxID=2862362 RepID=A0AAW0DMR4_9AGAR